VVVFTAGTAATRIIIVDKPVEIGRGDATGSKLEDGRVSRQHAVLACESGHCVITDLGSQNGTFVDGTAVEPHVPTRVERVVRIGDSLLVPYRDVRPLERSMVRVVDGMVRGPAMQAVLAEAANAGRSRMPLHIRGESGTGKEGVAQAFHAATGREAAHPVVVNCAAIPHGLAERLLFGSRRGAYSGAEADAAGYVQEADGGTLFLDEIADLDLAVQAKLLRVLESRELLPLGASKPRKVDFALCSATNKDLRALIAAGSFREDLYFRVGHPMVTLPALRTRPEEIPALIAHVLAGLATPAAAHVSFVEQCLLRPWPGNVRELITAVRIAAQAAHGAGDRVTARHLSATAGSAFNEQVPSARPRTQDEPGAPPTETPRVRSPSDDLAWRQRIAEALRVHDGNVSAAARALGLHRNQLRRFIEKSGNAADAGAGEDDEGDA
jgi:transcriptional regulator with PAS, ATPase and Fis domain